jgi:hypothetical protein
LFQEFLTSLLLTKYYNKTNVALNIANSGVYFYPQPSRDFSPLITQQSSQNYGYQLFVEEKNQPNTLFTNNALHKKKQPLHTPSAFIISYEVAKNP